MKTFLITAISLLFLTTTHAQVEWEILNPSAGEVEMSEDPETHTDKTKSPRRRGPEGKAIAPLGRLNNGPEYRSKKTTRTIEGFS